MSKKILIIIAQEGFRDEEYFIPRKIFDSAEIACTVASVTRKTAIGKLGGNVTPDISISETKPENYDAIMVVGGPGAPELGEIKEFMDLIKTANAMNKLMAAICIAPTLFAKAGILKNIKATVWNGDGKQNTVIEKNGGIYSGADVEQDRNIITADGPLSAEKFAKTIIRSLQ